MPQANEDEQQRETYGDAPGWSSRETEQAPTPRPKGEAGGSPPPDVEAAPSAEAAQEAPQAPEPATEQAPPTPSQPEQADVPFHQHPRWIERQRELEEARRQRDEAMRLAQDALQRPVQPAQPPPPQADPWQPLTQHSDPATAQFWSQMQTLVRHERQLAKQEAVQELQPVIQAGMEKLAQIDLRDFRRENPEIKPGSQEEAQIIAYMEGRVDGMRHPLESAKRNSLFDKLNAEVKSNRAKQAAIPAKRAAATTEPSSGIPQGAGLPGKPQSAVDRASEVADKGGGVLDVAKAFFGGGR